MTNFASGTVVGHDKGIGFGTEPLPRSGLVGSVTAGSVYTTGNYNWVSDDISLQQSGADDLLLVIDFHKNTGSPSVTFKVEGVVYPNGGEAIGGTPVVWTILTSAALTSTQVLVLQISDRLTAVAGLSANDIVPDIFRVTADNTNADTDSVSFTVYGVIAP